MVLGWVEKSPCHFGFAGERWTRRGLGVLIWQRLGVALPLQLPGRLACEHGATRHRSQRLVPANRTRREGGTLGWPRDWPRLPRKASLSVVAALSVAPQHRRVGLYFRPDAERYLGVEMIPSFLRGEVWPHLRGEVIVLWEARQQPPG